MNIYNNIKNFIIGIIKEIQKNSRNGLHRLKNINFRRSASKKENSKLNEIMISMGKKSIKKQLIIYTIVLVLVCIIATSVFTFIRMKDTLTEESRNMLSAVIEGQRTTIETMLEKEKVAALKLVGHDQVLDMLKFYSKGSDEWDIITDSFNFKLNKEVALSSNLDYIFVADREGEITSSSIPELVGESIKNEKYFQPTIELQRQSIGDVVVSPTTGKQVIIVTAPVYDEYHSIIGLIGNAVELDSIAENINNFHVSDKESFHSYLVNEKGIIVTHPDSNKIGTKIGNEPIKNIIRGLNNDEQIDSGIVEYTSENKEKIASYDIVGETKWIIVTAGDEDEITQPVMDMALSTLIIVSIILLISIVISYIGAKTFARPIENIANDIAKIARGDLSVKVKIKAKNEIKTLADSINIMSKNLGHFIQESKFVSSKLNSSSKQLHTVSSETIRTFDGISVAVDEIAQGSYHQSQDVEKTADLTKELNDRFIELMDKSKKMYTKAIEVNKVNSDGLQTINELQKNNRLNNESVSKIQNAVLTLADKISNIEVVLKTISDISKRTNLLALNASIEAARAGEAGRGFSVVAEEVRNLAEQSEQSTKDIRDIITKVQNDTESTVALIGEVESRSDVQTNSVTSTEKSFKNISYSVEDISGSIEEINNFIEEMISTKNSIVDSIQNISSVSEETASSAQEVSSSVETQLEPLNQVLHSIEELSNLAHVLEEELSKFKND
ncbi:methyl-accepting chemotaxis protein [Sporosalibacterium faouarense]|uniref:methyl-accepting chemotaxis protein n=1 Tax=Sporosalibacterium faouarense TaxID=516123 RepID=UPI00192C9A76|nr:methyl-accepting chemotaxis protein [Sporosalibacterium faouarense]